MLNLKYLETFIKVAEYGSFRKAADAMYITPSAVIKQIDALEEETGAALFDRTHRGLHLTKGGQSLYTDGKVLLDSAQNALIRARMKMDENDAVIRIGTSPVTPADIFADLWEKAYASWPELRFQILPFDDRPERVRDIMENLGDEIDVIGGIVDETHLSYRKCSGIELQRYPVKIAMPVFSPLSKKKKLSYSDLEGEKVFLISPGKIEVMDEIRTDLESRCKDISIINFDSISSYVIKRCENGEGLLITPLSWVKTHPLLKTADMEWSFEIPYGILFSRHPSAKVKKLKDIISVY